VKLLVKTRKIIGYMLLVVIIYAYRKAFIDFDYLLVIGNKFTLLGNIFIALFLIGLLPKKVHLSAVLSSSLILFVMLTFQRENILDQGIEGLILHYLTPIYLILDFIFCHNDFTYKYKDILYTTIIPVSYLIYTVFYYFVTSKTAYPFIDYQNRTDKELLSVIILLLLAYLAKGVLLLLIKKIYMKKALHL
jgi:uncharacterized membrane protein YphA (DoxX/SURF4 family)